MKSIIVLLVISSMSFFSLETYAQDNWIPEKIQAGFYTPQRVGQLWDTWLYFYDGLYYQFYLAGIPGEWDCFELMTSKDGVNWQEIGKILEPREGTVWMGTGHIIESRNFKDQPQWIMNYSEWFDDKQDIMFATSYDLLHWEKVNDSFHFTQDERWYKPKGRWDCIDCVKRNDGSFYGYFTADPIPEKFDHQVCGFGFAESKDGINWTARPPLKGNISGELGGIQKIRDKYYITVSEGRIASADNPEGPFHAQKKNPNMFGHGCDIYFPRFFHNPPLDKTLKNNGVLVNHFYTGEEADIYSAPLKAVDIDQEGILRLKWWEQNNLLKDDEFKLSPDKTVNFKNSVRLFNETFNTNDVGVIESNIKLNYDEHEKSPAGFYFKINNDSGYVLLFNRNATVFGTMNRDYSNLSLDVEINRDIDFPANSTVRLVFKRDMIEAYIDDYLVMLKRMNWSGEIGIIEQTKKITNIRAWVHD